MALDEVTRHNKDMAIAYWGRDLGKEVDVESAEFAEDFRKRFTDDYWNHASNAADGPDRGLENAKEVSKSFQELFTDAKFEITRVTAEGDIVVVEGMFTAVVTGGRLFGIPAAGQQVSQPHVHTLKFRDGKISEHFVVRDDFVMFAQMGGMEHAKGGVTHFWRESVKEGLLDSGQSQSQSQSQ
ncbi:MAG TPA: ester cyclase [Streptosporangiaceae bacterium]|jgi:predicted ester cyclase